MISGQSDTETILLPDRGSLGFGFKLIVIFLWNAFFHRGLMTDYKAHGSDLKGSKYHLTQL